MRFIFLILVLCGQTLYAADQEVHPFSSQTETLRFQSLTKEIRCVVCQNQSIADSNAGLANDLRKKVYHLMLQKKSDRDIKQYLVQRYGDFILFKPPLDKTTLFLWFFPIVLLFFIILIFYRFFKSKN